MSRTMMITGAAQGIGLTTARFFAQKGWRVGLYDVNSDKLAEVLDHEDFIHCFGGHCDVTSDESVADALQHFAEYANDTMDVLINNAGVLSAGAFEELDFEQQHKMVEVNVSGVMRMAYAAFPMLAETPNSCLVNLCSASSIHGVPTLAVYSSTKFFVNGFTEALALEWERHGIQVSCVKPPIIKTAMGEAAEQYLKGGVGALDPIVVAQTIDKAITQGGISYFVGGGLSLWSWLNGFLPEGARTWMAKKVLRYEL